MRTLTLTAVAVFMALGTLSASAASSCSKNKDEASCAAPSCKWTPASTSKKGKEIKAACSKAPKKAKKAA